VVGSCEHGDEPAGSGAMELLINVTGWYRTKRPMHCGHL
jgi:hypothetical protein